MSSQPVRIPEEQYEELRDLAASLDVTLSEAVGTVLTDIQRTGELDEIRKAYLDRNLDRDLAEERDEIMQDFELSQEERITELEELRHRQIARNRERSDLLETAQ